MNKSAAIKRDREIIKDYQKYKSYRAVGEKYKLSPERVRQIVLKAEKTYGVSGEDTEDSIFFKTITSLPLSDTHAYKLYYALKRINITTLEQLKSCTAETLTGKKNIGPTSIDALMKDKLIGIGEK